MLCMRLTSDLKTNTKLKVRRQKKLLPENGNEKKARVAALISDKIEFKIKNVTRDKGHCLIIKRQIQEDITIVSIYAPNVGAPQLIRQLLTAIKGEIDCNTVMVGDFNTQITDHPDRKLIKKHRP